jgi:hypothetical protein
MVDKVNFFFFLSLKNYFNNEKGNIKRIELKFFFSFISFIK